MTNSDDVKNKFYEDLHALLATVPKTDKLADLGARPRRSSWDQQVQQQWSFSPVGAQSSPNHHLPSPDAGEGDVLRFTSQGSCATAESGWSNPSDSEVTGPGALSRALSGRPQPPADNTRRSLQSQVDADDDLDRPPSLLEAVKAMQQLSGGKPPGVDTIQVEVYN
ncbi:hypothetical protein SprV_0200648200 [Sparganum proliferum]